MDFRPVILRCVLWSWTSDLSFYDLFLTYLFRKPHFTMCFWHIGLETVILPILFDISIQEITFYYVFSIYWTWDLSFYGMFFTKYSENHNVFLSYWFSDLFFYDVLFVTYLFRKSHFYKVFWTYLFRTSDFTMCFSHFGLQTCHFTECLWHISSENHILQCVFNLLDLRSIILWRVFDIFIKKIAFTTCF